MLNYDISLIGCKTVGTNVQNTTVQKHQFFGAQPSSQSNSHIHIWPQEKPWPWQDRPLLAKWCLCLWICLRVPWTARRSNQSILKISPRISLEGMMLKLKLQYFGHLMRRVDSLERTDAGRDWGQEEKGATEDEMAGWHHGLNGCESDWTPGIGDGQGGLACCDS